ncbi:MAG: hypothetical protein P9M03_03460 [Candidatus Theseobacter exili]|nr:hypothetical protein [Candidatus Theseobacter exili]
MKDTLKRDASAYQGKTPTVPETSAPFFIAAKKFDGLEAEYNGKLIDQFNKHLKINTEFNAFRLNREECEVSPDKIVIIDASNDSLPLSHESMRIFKTSLDKKGVQIPIVVVNERDELLKALDGNAHDTLVFSQCVDKRAYDLSLCNVIEENGAVVVPGKLTAPGSVFSDKARTYDLLSKNSSEWDLVAHFYAVHVGDDSVEEVVERIMAAVDDMECQLGIKKFFIKPAEGGGGLGGFRILKHGDDYLLPDMSKVSEKSSVAHPSFIDFDADNPHVIRELLWIYDLFKTEESTRDTYLKLNIEQMQKEMGLSSREETMKAYLGVSGEKQHEAMGKEAKTRAETAQTIVNAVCDFENKFQKRYHPIVNRQIEFGTWGLRAHYRLSTEGIILETIYSRIFQIEFSPDGIGYVGADNISNKQTGALEIVRLVPINKLMVNAIGGEAQLFRALSSGAKAMVQLLESLPEEERCRVPVRVQIDLAAPSALLCEGNADTARGLSLASNWERLIRNSNEWLEDALSYYSWKKS